jgi:hypothetical protein
MKPMVSQSQNLPDNLFPSFTMPSYCATFILHIA